MSEYINTRRQVLKKITGAIGLAALPSIGIASALSSQPSSSKSNAKASDFILCLNTSTIAGQNLGFIKELEVVSQAGFRSVEIWVPTLQAWLDKGGKLSEAKKRIGDLGLQVEDAITFPQWIVDDDAVRAKALEQFKKEMDMIAQLSCHRVAAPPSGANRDAGLDLDKAAERYRAIIDLGATMGVVPQLEIWGMSPNLSNLGEAMHVALQSGSAQARILIDVFHIFRGNTSVDAMGLVAPETFDILHMNDYPQMERTKATDADRVYPGDGVAPIERILETLTSPKRKLVLSLELFNKDYYKQDALTVCRTGLEKMKAELAAL